MQRNICHLEWEHFRGAVAALAEQIPPHCRGIYGIPRGGLCLAVALSHATGLPFLSEPVTGCAVVDEIVETGRAMRPFTNNDMLLLSWFATADGAAAIPDLIYQAPKSDADWLVFPWENKRQAEEECRAYHLSRQ